MKLAPLIFAVIQFMLIRLANDWPTGDRYLSHSWQFIATELSGILIFNYLGFYLAEKWVKYCVRRTVSPFFEYSAVTLFALTFSLLVMGMSHDVPLASEIPHLVIPVVIVCLMALWLHLSTKSNYLYRKYTEARLMEQEAGKAKAEADLRLLREQIHPHFLFNMLNTIYFSIDETNEKARGIVEHLSNLLRSQLYQDDSPVSVEREIEVLESYIELYRARFEDLYDIDISIDRRYGSDVIHRHLLLPLVENAMKHSGGTPRKIKISLKRDIGFIEFTVDNSTSRSDTIQEKPSGIGLDNLRRRLGLLYGGGHEFSTGNDNGIYHAHLKIKL